MFISLKKAVIFFCRANFLMWFLINSWRFTVIPYTMQNVFFGNYETPKTLHHVDYFLNTNDILDCGILWLGRCYFFNNTPCQFHLRFIIIVINKYTGTSLFMWPPVYCSTCACSTQTAVLCMLRCRQRSDVTASRATWLQLMIPPGRMGGCTGVIWSHMVSVCAERWLTC